MTLTKIASNALYVSEPNPAWFGNKANPAQPPSNWSKESSNWLKSRFHFQFAEDHSMPPNFGVLRVLNDDLVQPKRMFGTHPHRDMEIVTLVLRGNLTHADSMHNREALGRGSIQYMSAGTGVRHSEGNDSEEPLRFLQCWVLPEKRGLTPNYGSMIGNQECAKRRLNRFDHLVSSVHDKQSETPVKLHQDVNFHVVELQQDQSVSFTVADNRQAYIVCAEGATTVSSGQGEKVSLERHDALRAVASGPLTFQAVEHTDGNAFIVVIEMKKE